MNLSRASLFAICLGLLGLGAWLTLARGDAAQDFEAALADLPSCRVDADCTVLHTTCPLGCAHGVNVSAVDRLRQLAGRLSKQHAKIHGECAYDCIAPGPAMCDAGRCTLGPVQ